MTGVDPDPEMLTAARMRAARTGVEATFVKGRSERLPFADGRTVVLSRRTEPENDQWLLLQRLKLDPPAQPQPKITARSDPPPSGLIAHLL